MKLVLLDRDGVINENRPDSVKSLEEFVLIPAAIEAFALFKQHGFTCVIVTNQSIIGRGIITTATLHAIHERLRDTVETEKGKIEEIIICPDAPHQATDRRKPKPGMLLEALEKYKASPERTPMVGDALTDMSAAKSAGCPRYLVTTGKGQDAAGSIPSDLQPVVICKDILDAAQKIVEEFK